MSTGSQLGGGGNKDTCRLPPAPLVYKLHNKAFLESWMPVAFHLSGRHSGDERDEWFKKNKSLSCLWKKTPHFPQIRFPIVEIILLKRKNKKSKRTKISQYRFYLAPLPRFETAGHDLWRQVRQPLQSSDCDKRAKVKAFEKTENSSRGMERGRRSRDHGGGGRARSARGFPQKTSA